MPLIEIQNYCINPRAVAMLGWQNHNPWHIHLHMIGQNEFTLYFNSQTEFDVALQLIKLAMESK